MDRRFHPQDRRNRNRSSPEPVGKAEVDVKPNVSFLALLALVIAGCGNAGGSSAREPVAAKVARRDITGYVTMDARVYVPPESEAHVRPPYRAPVDRVLTSVGQRVRRGEVLIELQAPGAEQAYADAQAAVKAAETALANAKTTYEAPVREARRRLQEAQGQERQARALMQQDPSATVAWQAARDQRQQAEEALRTARAAADAELLPYRQQLTDAQRYFTQARSGVKETGIRAPLSGTVLKLDVQPGSAVGETANESLAYIADLGDIKLKADVRSSATEYVKRGSKVVIRFTDLPDRTFDGTVTALKAIPGNGATAYEATIDFRNDEGLVKPESTTSLVGVQVGKVSNVLAVPEGAIERDEGQTIVRVQSADGKWTPTLVETGLSDGEYVEIKSGLKEGDTVQVRR